jgi:hypothetical protein
MDFKCDYYAGTLRHELAGGHVIDMFGAIVTHKATGKVWQAAMIVHPKGRSTAVLNSLGYRPGGPGWIWGPDGNKYGALLDNFDKDKEATKIVKLEGPNDLPLFAPVGGRRFG